MIGIGGKNIVDYNSAWLFFMIYLHIVLKAVFVLFFVSNVGHTLMPPYMEESVFGDLSPLLLTRL